MESSETILFYEKCRLCLENPGFKHIFETQDLHHDIFSCTGVKVTRSDNLPQKICSKCLDVVTKTKELRLLAGKNETIMKSLFLNDLDDDSRDTLYIVEEDDDLPQTHEPEGLNKSQQKRKNNTAENSDENENGDSIVKNKVKVRKDLFKTKTTGDTKVKNKVKVRKNSTNDDIVTVRSKEDYDRYKKQIKFEPGITVVYECEACEKEFETYKKLYLHIRLHNKNIFCPLDACGKKFATKGDLEKHVRTHTGYKPFTCEICEKSFTQQGTLKAHKENVHYCFVVPTC